MKLLILFTILLNRGVFANMDNLENKNKEIVLNFFDYFSSRNQKFNELVDPNVSWWVAGPPPFGKEYLSAKDYFTMLATHFSGFTQGLLLKVDHILAEGDFVAAEVSSDATHICKNEDGKNFHYQNKYHFKIKIKNGKFVEVKEYNDSYHLNDLFELTQSKECKLIIKNFYENLNQSK